MGQKLQVIARKQAAPGLQGKSINLGGFIWLKYECTVEYDYGNLLYLGYVPVPDVISVCCAISKLYHMHKSLLRCSCAKSFNVTSGVKHSSIPCQSAVARILHCASHTDDEHTLEPMKMPQVPVLTN